MRFCVFDASFPCPYAGGKRDRWKVVTKVHAKRKSKVLNIYMEVSG